MGAGRGEDTDAQRVNRQAALIVSYLPEDAEEAWRVLATAVSILSLPVADYPAAHGQRCRLCALSTRRGGATN